MGTKQLYTHSEFKRDARLLADKIIQVNAGYVYAGIYGVPSGGIPLAMELARLLSLPLIMRPEKMGDRVLIVDDLIDSGRTRSQFPTQDFACLHEKKHASVKATFSVHKEVEAWIVYWWEGTEEKSIEDAVVRQLQFIGENPNREGLMETPTRVVKAWGELFGGYQQKPEDVLKTFVDGACDEMVLLSDIEFYSTCEHHLLPFFGKAHVAYIPDGKVIGVSKLARLLDMYAKRAQIQERIGEQVTSALMEHLRPKGAACIISAQHFCMKSRGVRKQDSMMVTSSLKGVFLDKPESRSELLSLIAMQGERR